MGGRVDLEELLTPQGALVGRDVLNRIRTAVLARDRKVLGAMPEFVPDEIAGLRNLAVYDYGMEADEFVHRTQRKRGPGVAHRHRLCTSGVRH